jgi:uncharacterized membrane protein YdjX (TVP38/TMEM64 family)
MANSSDAIPKLVARICWVAGTFFAASGLLKMKDWIVDSERNTFNAFLFRLIVAALLILLPYILMLTTGTFFGRADGRMDVVIGINPGQLTAFQKAGK